MKSSFLKKSKEIADEFIQSIVFLDDRVYNRSGEEQQEIHDLDAFQVSSMFAKRQKICAIYDPQSLQDIESFKFIANKADVIVLDWKIELNEIDTNQGDDEEDDDNQEVRGTFTIEIVKEITKSNPEGLKIILIYTGETDLYDITNTVANAVGGTVNEENCQIDFNNIRFLVRAKSNNQEGEDTRFTHAIALRQKVLKYRELPDFLIEEFTKLTQGLLSNFVLKSLSTIRANTSKILGLYNKDLDHAFLEHKSSIPVQQDADTLLIDIFKDSIGDLLHYKKVHQNVDKKQIEGWLKANILNEELIAKKIDGNPVDQPGTFIRKRDLLVNLLYSDERNVEKRFVDIFTTILGSKGKAEKYFKYLLTNNIELFINNSQSGDKEDLISRFAKLTHHKNIFLPLGTKPFLSLGSIIKSSKTDSYYICIQQKCDSVRIVENDRKFLFLPMSISTNGKFNFITQDGVKLRLDLRSYNLRTLKFKANKLGVVEPTKNKAKFFFKQVYDSKQDEQFEWILDLKDLHAQRIVADYASSLSRVGLDESEWLRRSGS